jgi:hypothetical protein
MFESTAQTPTVAVSTHVGAEEEHTEDLQVHVAEPAAPVHVWCVPGHAAGVPYDQHPLLPRVHVARLPETQVFWPDVQLFVQVAEHMAFGVTPEHVVEAGQLDVDATKGQPLPSAMHWAIVCAS